MVDFIIAFDPSGSFHEGKGTTGWCVLSADHQIIEHGIIRAVDHGAAMDYYLSHEFLLDYLVNRYPSCAIVIEDYLLYGTCAASQINSRMETVQIIGILKYLCHFKYGRPAHMQTAALVKRRWANPVLEHKKIIVKKRRLYLAPCNGEPINEHSLDAIRHALHYATFQNKEEKHDKDLPKPIQSRKESRRNPWIR